MTVDDLITALRSCPQDADVIWIDTEFGETNVVGLQACPAWRSPKSGAISAFKTRTFRIPAFLVELQGS